MTTPDELNTRLKELRRQLCEQDERIQTQDQLLEDLRRSRRQRSFELRQLRDFYDLLKPNVTKTFHPFGSQQTDKEEMLRRMNQSQFSCIENLKAKIKGLEETIQTLTSNHPQNDSSGRPRPAFTFDKTVERLRKESRHGNENIGDETIVDAGLPTDARLRNNSDGKDVEPSASDEDDGNS